MATLQPQFLQRPDLPGLEAVDKAITAALSCDSPQAAEVTRHVLRGGGKRLRPALVLLSASFASAEPAAVVAVGAAAELVHVASLVHDDIIDGARLRRGRATVHAIWGRQPAVLAGDFLFARAFKLLVAHGQFRAVGHFSAAIADMCEAEIEQAGAVFEPEPSEDTYLSRIGKKTASLLVACCRAGAELAGLPGSLARGLEQFAHEFGLAYQLTDDLLDFTGSAREAGKPVAADFRRGIMTLPVIYLLRDPQHAPGVRRLIAARRVPVPDWERVRTAVIKSGALEAARETARRHAARAATALEVLPAGRQRELLEQLCASVLERKN